MVFRFQVKWLMLTRSTVQKQIFFSPGVFIILNSNSASCKEKNFSPQSSVPAFLAHLFNADSGLLQSGRCGIFVVKPIDYPNCFMTQAQFVINCSLWVGNNIFPDSHPQMHTPIAPRVDEGIQSDADSTHLSLRNHWRTQAVHWQLLSMTDMDVKLIWDYYTVQQYFWEQMTTLIPVQVFNWKSQICIDGLSVRTRPWEGQSKP